MVRATVAEKGEVDMYRHYSPSRVPSPALVAAIVALMLFFLWPQAGNRILIQHFRPQPAPQLGHAIYVVEGTAIAQATIIYRVRDRSGDVVERRVENAALPWTYDLDFYGGQLLAVNAIVTPGSGPISCRVHLDTITSEPVVTGYNTSSVACAIRAPEPAEPAPAPARPAPQEPKQVDLPTS
jgi:hypothetical protein